MPIPDSCIAKKEDLEKRPHMSDIELQQLDIGGVMLVTGLIAVLVRKENQWQSDTP